MTQHRLTKIIITIGFCLIWIVSSAHTENFVRVVSIPGGDPSFINVDVDSIRKGDDSLVYFSSEDDMGVSPSAIDCQQRVYYGPLSSTHL